jgi:hypothetical protein
VRGRRYWLEQGPITRDETRRAQEFFRKKGKSFERGGEAFRNFVARLRKRREVNRYLKGKEPAAADPSAPWQIVYGDRVVGGAITFLHSSGPNADNPDKYLHVVITIACHEINLIKAVYFDDYQVQWGTDLLTRPTGQVNATGIFAGLVVMQINYGSDGQAALSVPVGQTTGHNPVGAKWTSADRQRGHAHVYLRLENNEAVFKNGTPEITFAVSGKYDVVDPRTGTNAPGAANAAMVLYDYMTNTRFGLGVSPSAFNSARLNQAVTDCEDLIALAGGGTEYRYLVDCLITADESPGAVIEQLLASMAGHMVYSEGKWSVYAGKPRSAVMTIDEDLILSDVRLLTKTPRIDSFNTVRATYVSDRNGYEEADAPEVKNTAYIAEDSGVVVPEDFTYQYVTSGSRVQRLMKIDLNEARQGRFVEFTARLAAYQVEAGEWFAVNFSRFGWVGQTFRMVRTRLQSEASADGPPLWTVRVTAKAVEAATFDWLAEESPADQYPDTNLPNPFEVQPPSAVVLASGSAHLYVRADGTVFSRLLISWTAAPDSFVLNGGYYEVQYLAAEIMTDWLPFTDVPGSSTSVYMLDVLDGVGYQARVRSVNGLGARSAWATSGVHVVAGKTEPPSAVTGLRATVNAGGVRLDWAAVADLDVREYEVRYAAAGQTWAQAAANNPVRVRATTHTFPTFVWGGWRFLVRALDTSGNYSAADAAVDVVVSAPGAPRSLAAAQIDTTVLVDWEAPATTTFPIDSYHVYRQTATGTAFVGKVPSTFATIVELVPGAVTYLVAAVDVAGNQGPTAAVTRTVYAPPDYVFRDEAALDLAAATLANAAYVSGPVTLEVPADTAQTWEQHFVRNHVTTVQGLIDAGNTFWLEPGGSPTGTVPVTTGGPSAWLPFDAAVTWAEHFTNNGFDQIQDFIAAGYPYWLTPSSGTAVSWEALFAAFGAATVQGLYEAGCLTFGQAPPAAAGVVTLDYDLGEVLPQTVTTVAYELLSNGFTPTPQVFWRREATDPWTAGPAGRLTVTPTNYRYLRLVVSGQAATVTDWAVVSAVTVRVDVREIADGGTVGVLAADVGGTFVPFNRPFLDVSSLVVSAAGASELKAVRQFTDAANPAGFYGFLYDAAGTRVDGTISWHARGVQAVV